MLLEANIAAISNGIDVAMTSARVSVQINPVKVTNPK